MTFDKDRWIRSALRAGYLKVFEDGSIYRRRFATRTGDRMSSDFLLVKPQIHKKSGRVYFNMTWLGITKSVLVNRVVAWAFLPNPNNLPQVNHIDGNKENNAVSNLEWSSGHDNEKHAHRTGLKTGRGSQNSNARLTAAQVIEIRQAADPVKASDPKQLPALIRSLAEQYGVGRSTIINIVNRKTWIHV